MKVYRSFDGEWRESILGSEQHWVCGPTVEGSAREVASFGATTAELIRLAEWLKARQVESVAMESTGVYWIAPHEVLEGQGLQVLLLDTRQLARVPGRDKKTDPTDCEWIQRLHSCGLLRGSFRPEEAVCMLRTLVRDKANLVAQVDCSYTEASRQRPGHKAMASRHAELPQDVNAHFLVGKSSDGSPIVLPTGLPRAIGFNSGGSLMPSATTTMVKRLGTLLDRVEQGEQIVITRPGKAIARLVPNTRQIDQNPTREVLERIRKRAGRLPRRKPVPFN